MRVSPYPLKKTKIKLSDKFYYGFSKKEIIWMIVFIIIASFISFIPLIPNDNPIKIITALIIFSLIIIINTTTKKIFANKYSIKIEHKIWTFQRWGLYRRSYFKKPFPIGLIFSFFIALFTLGFLKPFLFFQFDAEIITKKRLLKSEGQRRAQRKDYLNEEGIAYTSASGFYSLLILAAIGIIFSSIFNFSPGLELAKFSIYYGIWNLVPFGNLDGSKLFFGAFVGWVFILNLYLLFLGLLFLF